MVDCRTIVLMLVFNLIILFLKKLSQLIQEILAQATSCSELKSTYVALFVSEVFYFFKMNTNLVFITVLGIPNITF